MHIRLHAWSIVLLAALGSVPPTDARRPERTTEDSWGVRLLGTRVETLSKVNMGMPARDGSLRTRHVTTRRLSGAAIELHADLETAAKLDAQAPDFAPELDTALQWLQRMRPPGQPRARIILTLVDTRHRTTWRRSHPVARATIVDVLVAVPDAPTPLSVGVGKALSTALHEMRHALSARGGGARRPSRRDDEYQASLVESCYLVSTMRTGDTLRLTPRERAGMHEYFVSAQSRNAAHDAVRDLVRASGTPIVRWYDGTARAGLERACANALPTLPATQADTAVPHAAGSRQGRTGARHRSRAPRSPPPPLGRPGA
ncbi:hypothetical protein [Luteimonas vadosa]|uniref:Secreted protein n=1 Tax=Luteimonas vadosa TaxID=1165507 RepID=A0ABP9E085_9GAMM